MESSPLSPCLPAGRIKTDGVRDTCDGATESYQVSPLISIPENSDFPIWRIRDPLRQICDLSTRLL
jgi:hypothetical protein